MVEDWINSGIDLIATERSQQLNLHGFTVKDDVFHNSEGQLAYAAEVLLRSNPDGFKMPEGWKGAIWNKMINKPRKERMVIAGALIAAELDRLNYK